MEMSNKYRILVGKPVRKIPFGRPVRRWENIELIRKIGLEGVGWINLPQETDRWWVFVNTVINTGVQ